MRSKLSIKVVGLSVSAVLAIPYMLIMLASLFLVGWFTTSSWQAVLLGISWSTIAGIEIGLLGIILLGCAVAVVFVPAYNFIRRRTTSQSGRPAAKSWPFKILSACLVLPALTLILLRALAPVLSSGIAQVPSARNQPVNMGSTINTAFREAEPSFTGDGQTMYFNCNSGDICVSYLIGTWEAGNWTTPERLGAPINTVYEEVEPVINTAGDKLYFTSIRPAGYLLDIPFLSPFMNVLQVVNTLATGNSGHSFFGGLGLSDVYVSYLVDGVWSEPQNINDLPDEPPVNTPYADHCLFFSADGNEAFWTSTRPGGLGSNDIWTSRRVDGKWTEPENLGPKVNGPGSEHTSIPTPDGRSLYVTTARPEGYGGEDNYVTTRGRDGQWGPLVNLGPLVNGTGDDRCPAWTPDLKFFLFDSVRADGYGGKDIWWVYFKDVPGYPLVAE